MNLVGWRTAGVTYSFVSMWLYVVVSDDPCQLLKARLRGGLWPISQRTLGRTEFRPDDRVVFYLGRPVCAFAGEAAVAAAVQLVDGAEQKLFPLPDRGRKYWDYGVRLKDAVIWDEPVPARPLINYLSTFPRKDCWGRYLQSGAARLSDEDYEVITKALPLAASGCKKLRRIACAAV